MRRKRYEEKKISKKTVFDRMLYHAAFCYHSHRTEYAHQVLISTHSPFMLSDVMASQVIKMNYDEYGRCIISKSERPYYAANVSYTRHTKD